MKQSRKTKVRLKHKPGEIIKVVDHRADALVYWGEPIEPRIIADHRTNMTINGKPLMWADGRPVVPGDIKPGQTISFDPRGLVSVTMHLKETLRYSKVGLRPTSVI